MKGQNADRGNSKKNALDILRSLRDDELSQSLRTRIRAWLAAPEDRDAKDAALEEIFNEMFGTAKISRCSRIECLNTIKKLGFSENTVKRYEASLRTGKIERRTFRRSIPLQRMLPMRVAMLLTPIFVIAGGLYYWSNKKTGPVSEPQFAGITVIAGEDATKQLMLPDSSWVWLNEGSKIVYTEGSSEFLADRSVYLEGEAFFSVRAGQESPFLVVAKGFVTKVIGTQFNVRAYDAEMTSHVSLIEGSVEVIAKNNTYRLRPHERLIFEKPEYKARLEAADTYSCTPLWIDLDDTHLSDVFSFLSTHYNVSFEVNGTLHPEECVTARLRYDCGLETIMGILKSNIMSFDYEISENFVRVDMTDN